jgi:hypothetical protein
VTAAGRPVALGLLALATAAPAAAAGFTLTPAQQQEALRVGQRSITRETFDAEWRVVNAAGETVVVLTPFHRLVIAARHAAFRNEAIRPREVERALREQRDRLVLWAQLRGPREDFARFYVPRLVVGDREIEPAFVQNERTAARAGDGVFRARCVYAFPTRDLSGTARVQLVVRNSEGRDVNRFTLDLGRMR